MASKQLSKYDTIVEKSGVTIEKEQFEELLKKMKQYMVLTSELTSGSQEASKYRSKIKLVFNRVSIFD